MILVKKELELRRGEKVNKNIYREEGVSLKRREGVKRRAFGKLKKEKLN